MAKGFRERSYAVVSRNKRIYYVTSEVESNELHLLALL